MTVIEALDLKTTLVENPNLVRPLQYRERTGHIINEQALNMKETLNALKDYSEAHKMKINIQKTEGMLFNASKSLDFLPKLQIDQSNELRIVDQHKLLGVIITSNLSWQAQIDYMCQSAYKRMWILRRLKYLGASITDLVSVYTTQIRCVIEFSVAVWNSALTEAQICQLERIQRCALSIILSDQYRDYKTALSQLNLEVLSVRRKHLCRTFAVKSAKHPKFASWFCQNDEKLVNTRSKREKYKPVIARTNKYQRSPLAYLTELLNEK